MVITDVTMAELGQVNAMPFDEEIETLDPRVGKCDMIAYYAIRTNEVGSKLIGLCSAYNYVPPQIEMGIRIWHRAYWGKGYGTEAVRLFCEWMLAFELVSTILVKTPVYNVRAVKCYEKAGFREYARQNVDGYDMILMKLERGEA